MPNSEQDALREALEDVRDDLDALYFGKHDPDTLAAGILAQKHLIDAALTASPKGQDHE
jgi:hypothetical protein